MNPVSPLFGPAIPPPPMPPAPLGPPAFALTGTGPVVTISALPEPAAVEPVEHLRVVPNARSRAAKAPFVTLVLTLLGGGLVTLLLVNTALSQGAFAVQKLQRNQVTLTEQQQQLRQALADADRPEALASRAAALGMVPGAAPAFLRLPDGKVLGTPKVAVSPPPPAPKPTVAPTPTTAPAAQTTAPVTPAAAVPLTSAAPPAVPAKATP